MEQSAREVGAVSRGQNVAYVMPHDWMSIAQFLGPAVERVDESAQELQLLVIASDVEVAAAVSAAAVRLAEGRDIAIVGATSATRAATLLRIRPAQIVAATPQTIVEMLQSATLKLATVRAVCIAWADELVTRGASATLETVMSELPKEGARIVVTSELTPAVEELLERYARRARRVATVVADTDQPIPVSFASVLPETRLLTLRRLIDQTEPRSALVFVRDGESAASVDTLLRALGYAGESPAITTGLVAAPGTDVVFLFDLPVSRAELREATAGAKRVIALVQPRQLTSLRGLAAGGPVTPVSLPEAGARARDRDEQARAELRTVLAEGVYGRELLALEPLLENHDGIEIAAALLQVLDRERAARATASAAASAAGPRDRTSSGMTKLFVNIGERDSVRPGDLVGAIANQAGVSSAEIGKVDVRESFSLVEVSSGIADAVITKVTGVEIRGRRAVLRREEDRPPRAPREGGREGGRDGGREGRGGRSDGPRGAGPRDAKRGPPRDRSSAPRRPRTGDRE